jgi:pyridoxamine 5'-phosphate oxidase
MENNMKQFRQEYKKRTLTEQDILNDPFLQFSAWFREAADFGISEPNAMVLATADARGMPSARMVLLKGLESGSFVFFTNFGSRKGTHLSNNPKAALLFYWPEMERQIRIEGTVEKVVSGYSDAYFACRPYESQAAAIASEQSAPLHSREDLEKKYQAILSSAAGKLARPPHWGGFKLIPVLFEFWQGREHRLHDRIQYRVKDPEWAIERLAP